MEDKVEAADDEFDNFTPSQPHRQTKRKSKSESRDEEYRGLSGTMLVWSSIGLAVFVGMAVLGWSLLSAETPPVISELEVRPFVERSFIELQAKTSAMDALIHFQETNWQLTQDTGKIEFKRQDGFKFDAPFQIIGSFNSTDNSWMWAWSNDSINENLKEDAQKVRTYGEEHKVKALTTAKFNCTEEDCWEFASLACKLADAQGVYRCPSGSTYVFVTFGKVAMSKQ